MSEAITRASFGTEDTYTPDALIADGKSIRAKVVTLLTGQSVVRGQVLGKVAVGTASSAAKSGGNTGNGTMGSVTVGAAQAGVYQLRIITAATDAGEFQVTDPQGDVVGIGNVGVAFSGGGLSFTLADGATDFIVGDGFDITVAAGSGKYKSSVAAATDGSQTPDVIAAETVDATAADKGITVYISGDFNQDALTLGAGHTSASIADGLRAKGIFLHNPVSA